MTMRMRFLFLGPILASEVARVDYSKVANSPEQGTWLGALLRDTSTLQKHDVALFGGTAVGGFIIIIHNAHQPV